MTMISQQRMVSGLKLNTAHKIETELALQKKYGKNAILKVQGNVKRIDKDKKQVILTKNQNIPIPQIIYNNQMNLCAIFNG